MQLTLTHTLRELLTGRVTNTRHALSGSRASAAGCCRHCIDCCLALDHLGSVPPWCAYTAGAARDPADRVSCAHRLRLRPALRWHVSALQQAAGYYSWPITIHHPAAVLLLSSEPAALDPQRRHSGPASGLGCSCGVRQQAAPSSRVSQQQRSTQRQCHGRRAHTDA